MSNTRWADLPVDVWVHILSHLHKEPDLLNPEWACYHGHSLQHYAQKICSIHKLRLVCTKFNAALDDTQFSYCLFLPASFKYKRVPSFLQQVHRYRTSVRLFVADAGSPTLEAALSALVCPGSQLLLAYVDSGSAFAVHILSCHRALQTVELVSTADRTISDLTPLAALPCLGSLILRNGQFCCEETLLHMTSLQLSDAEISFANACFCGSKLVELDLRHSLLFGCDQGLAACHNLRNLGLRQCCFGASHDEDELCLLRAGMARIPTSLSTLSQLTSLFITLCGQSLLAMQFSWLASLTSLQKLAFRGAGATVKLPSELTELTRLESLSVSMDGETDDMTYIDFQVRWGGMRALRGLSIGVGTYAFDNNLLQLVECKSLVEVSFNGIKPYSAESAKFFAVLISKLAVKKPDVVCYLDDEYLSEID